jgi:hypothetical protein
LDDPKRRVGTTLWLLAMCGVLALAGGLYWRYGIEAAIAAHALAHVLAHVGAALVNK